MGLILFSSISAAAEKNTNKPHAEDLLSQGLTYLLDIVEKKRNTTFNPRLVEPVLNFVEKTEKAPRGVSVEKYNTATPSYGGFVIQRPLKEILTLIYHPHIPSSLFSPTSARISYWKKFNGQKKSINEIWRLIASSNNPVIISGVEHEMTTPDINSGAYYRYDQNRTLIFYRHNGAAVFISITKQIGRSDVGRKGIVLGSDEEWNYFYSGLKGLAKMPLLGKNVKVPGLSKIDSYLYDSYSVLVLYELGSNKSAVKCGMFKWINAGWQNVNMVKEKHVYKGIRRYAKSFKEVMENPYLPTSSELARMVLSIENLSVNALRKKIRIYFEQLEEKCRDEGLDPGKTFNHLINSETYLKQMTKKEMQSILVLEYLKNILGKDPILDLDIKKAAGRI